MKSSKGFTLPEMLVAVLIVVITMAAAMSFFVFQSVSGYESFRTKAADEAVETALAIIKRDIRHAGLGVMNQLELAMLVKEGASGAPDELYLNYNAYLATDGDTEVIKDQTMRAFASANNVFMYGRNFDFPGGVVDYQGYWAGTGSNTAHMYIRGVLSRYHIGAFLTKSVDPAAPPNVSDVLVEAADEETCSVCPPGIKKFKITFLGSIGTDRILAPAVHYRVIEDGEGIGRLWRNPGPSPSSSDRPVLGSHNFDVTAFSIRCQFVDSTGAVTWIPDDGTKTFTDMSLQDLKLIEITIRYRTKNKKNIWETTRTRTINVAPRSIVLLARG
jgi:prepilin-type N-terminal cleavage/methylation domain-containing protein